MIRVSLVCNPYAIRWSTARSTPPIVITEIKPVNKSITASRIAIGFLSLPKLRWPAIYSSDDRMTVISHKISIYHSEQANTCKCRIEE
ncbi:unnamed protein product [Medioppia subpectinata]|uniref:Uncharacterized protein n=1 Tax=Medioppia subpectinata TaxID=1979941 RepID=A0A7R9PVN8_9ACAR|nr:unnamed protein product [Medioppia subpectinata]CAG2102899.1 unnamed protein product [Medioppia subpectinata]